MRRKKQIKNTLNFCGPFLHYQKTCQESKSTFFDLRCTHQSRPLACTRLTLLFQLYRSNLYLGTILKLPTSPNRRDRFFKFKQRPLLAEVGCVCNASSVFDWIRIWYIYSLRFFGLHHQLWPVPTMSKSISPLACDSCVSFKMSLRKKEHAHAILR